MRSENKFLDKMGVPDTETLQKTLREILDGADLESFTKRAARRELEKKLGLEENDLEDQKTIIAEWVDKYIQDKEAVSDEEEADEGDKSESSQDEAKAEPAKKKTAKKAGWKPIGLKPNLAEFFGNHEGKRSDVVKAIWDHVKANGLKVGGISMTCSAELSHSFH